jgi:hypothetical protein
MGSAMRSIFNIFKNTSKLFGKSFSLVFQLLITTVIASLPLNILYFIVQKVTEQNVTEYAPVPMLTLFLNASIYALQILIIFVAFNAAISGVYNQYHQQRFDFMRSIINGIKRIPSMLSYLTIYILPLLLLYMTLGIVIVQGYGSNLPAWGDKAIIAWCALLLMVNVVILIYTFVAPILIISKNVSGWSAIYQSCRLIKGHWWKTLAFVLLAGLIFGLLIWASICWLPGKLPWIFGTVILFVYGPSLMVVYHDYLETDYRV